MSFRTTLKRLAERATGTDHLRDRATDLKAGLGRLTQRAAARGADQSRRTMVAGSLAAAIPLPVAAAAQEAGFQEAAFLTLIPQAVPLLRRLMAAQAEMNRLDIEADRAAGGFPGLSDEQRRREWADRAHTEREANGFGQAWEAVSILEREMNTLLDEFETVPMGSLQAILFKAALNDLGEWWGESATADLRRLAAERFGLPALADQTA